MRVDIHFQFSEMVMVALVTAATAVDFVESIDARSRARTQRVLVRALTIVMNIPNGNNPVFSE